jgi:hypothetical protein
VVVTSAVNVVVEVSVAGAGVIVVEGVLVIRCFATKGMVKYLEVVGTGFFADGPSPVVQTFKIVLVLRPPAANAISALETARKRIVAAFMVPSGDCDWKSSKRSY